MRSESVLTVWSCAGFWFVWTYIDLAAVGEAHSAGTGMPMTLSEASWGSQRSAAKSQQDKAAPRTSIFWNIRGVKPLSDLSPVLHCGLPQISWQSHLQRGDGRLSGSTTMATLPDSNTLAHVTGATTALSMPTRCSYILKYRMHADAVELKTNYRSTMAIGSVLVELDDQGCAYRPSPGATDETAREYMSQENSESSTSASVVTPRDDNTWASNSYLYSGCHAFSHVS